jgi:hypothetical protein
MRIRSRLAILVMGLAFLLAAAGAWAQGAPEQINAALADLSARVGTTVTLNSLSNWSWEQASYPDASLGCPQPGQTYAQVQTLGYRFELTYNLVLYDYRVSADQTLVILCSETPLTPTPGPRTPLPPTLTPTPGPTEIPEEPPQSNALCPLPQSAGLPQGQTFAQTRLAPGIQAQVTPGLPNNLRIEPRPDAELITQVPAEVVFTVVQGPTCDNAGRLWWQIDFDGQIGWTVEWLDGEYVLEPFPALPLPNDLPAIDAENAADLGELARLYGSFASDLTIAQESETSAPPILVALGAAGSEGAWIYDLGALDAGPRVLTAPTLLTAVDFGPNLDVPLFGGDDGAIRFWDVRPTATLVERAFLNSQLDPVSAVAFSRDGAIVASTGGQAIQAEEREDNLYAIAFWEVDTVSQLGFAARGHTAEVTALDFIDADTLISASLDGTVREWTLPDATAEVYELSGSVNAIAVDRAQGLIFAGLESGAVEFVSMATDEVTAYVQDDSAITAIALNLDGTLLIYATESGVVRVWDVAGGEEIATLIGHSGPIEALAFSPDGTLFATLGEDNTIRLWGVTGSVG